MPVSLPFSLDTKTKKLAAVGAGISVLALILGIAFGYLTGHRQGRDLCGLRKGLKNTCTRLPYSRTKYDDVTKFFWRSLSWYKVKVCLPKGGSCHTERLPGHYISYHLNGKSIVIDGQDSDPAWSEVPWSSRFIDMRGKWLPTPRFETKYKMRWDDTKMYVLMYMQETDLYGTHTINDTSVWKDNGVEMLMDVDGSMRYYKQVQVNVLGAFHDLMFRMSPHDAGHWDDSSKSWGSGIQYAINYTGTINNPSDKDKYWRVEMSFPWEALAQNSSRAQPQPRDNEVWFIQFGRSEWKLNVTNNTYVKANTKGGWRAEDWWSWTSCRAVNLHLPDRWGLVQFKKNIRDKKFLSTQWHVYRALLDVFEALTKYKALHKLYTDSLFELDVPASLFSRVCVEVPTINLTRWNNTDDFIVTVKSRLITHRPAHIRSNRYVWFQ